MSVLVKGVKLPKNCHECDAFGISDLVGLDCSCVWSFPERPKNCPLVEIPEKHGRLIDADALIDDIRKNSQSYFADDFAHEWVNKQHTVIEAEGE